MRNIYNENNQIIKILLFGTFVLLCFNYIPQIFRMDALSASFSRKASWYPLFVLTLYYFFNKYYKNNDLIEKRIVLFLGIYLLYILMDSIFGLIKFPYYEEIINGPKDQITKLPDVKRILSFFELDFSIQDLTYYWFIIRTLKEGVFTILYTFGFSFILFVFVRRKFELSFKLLRKAIYFSVGIICIYSIIEIFYFSGSILAKNILANINPFIYDLYTNGRNYPPLFWYASSMRSIFIEPSHFGMYTAFIMPILWYEIIKDKNKTCFIFVALILSFFIFMTKARTATLLVLGELCLFTILLLYFYGKEYLKSNIIIILITILGMIFSVGFIKHLEVPVASKLEAEQQTNLVNKINYNLNKNEKNNIKAKLDNNKGIKKNINVIVDTEKIKNTKIEPSQKITSSQNVILADLKKYIDRNILSVIGSKYRSNNSRYAIYITNWNIGKEHPIIGVGYGLNKAYFIHYMPEDFVKGNPEIKKWKGEIKKYGLMKFSISNIGEYITLFSQTGIVGLVLFLVPWILPLIILFRRTKTVVQEKRILYICFYTMFVGMIVSGFGDNLQILYTPWIALAFVWALIYPIKKEENNDYNSYNTDKC